MKKLFLLIVLASTPLLASEPELKDIYGNIVAGCTVAADIDEGDADLIGPLAYQGQGSIYTAFCYDSATFAGVACRIKQGGATVNASSGEGSDGEAELFFAGEKTMFWVSKGREYLSFEPLADAVNTQVGVACRRN